MKFKTEHRLLLICLFNLGISMWEYNIIAPLNLFAAVICFTGFIMLTFDDLIDKYIK